MADIARNTLYLTTPATYVARDHLTLQVEVPVYPPDLPPEERQRDRATDWRRVSIPIHHLESVCIFGANSISPPALDLCWEQGVAVNYLTESATYFGVFTSLLKQQRENFAFTTRTRRPPRDRINCLLSFLYALVRHDCVAALTVTGLDPFVGFLHAERPNRPALALDLMEEFRPWLADRLAVTLVNRQQVGPDDFREREGGAVEFTEAGRKRVITAYQQRKQELLQHALLDQNLRVGQLPFVQARVLARHLRGDLSDYVPFVPK